MGCVTPKDKAIGWGVARQYVEVLLGNRRIPGVYRLDCVCAVPKDTRIDERTHQAKDSQKGDR